MNLLKSIALALAAVALCLGADAQAQDAAATEYVPGADALKTPPPEREDGWHPALTLGANLNLASNSNVVGQVDGFSLLVGANIIGELRLIDGKHDWKNTVSLSETWAKTPVIDEFLKSNDLLDVESLYRFFAWTWGGPYARLNLQTPLFSAESVTAEPQTYVLEGQDPVANGVLTDRFELANPFEPLTISESVGMFADPITGPHLNVSLRGGFGGRHTFAKDVRLITNDDDSNAVTFVELLDVHQAGLELFAGLDGKAADERLSYNAGLAVLFPFLNNDKTNRGAGELTRIAVQAGLTTNVFTWMALSYQLRVVNDPQLIDKVQIQNSLLLTFSYTFSDAPPPAPEEPADADAIKAAEQRAAAAEERAKLAEERAKLAEERAKAAAEPAPVAPAPVESAVEPAAAPAAPVPAPAAP
jgi:hypothetical protein